LFLVKTVKHPPPLKSYPHRPTGRVVEGGVTCGVCESITSINKGTAKEIRHEARILHFRFVPAWGWVCPRCYFSIPGFSDPRKKKRPGPQPSEKRVQVNPEQLFD